MDHGRTRRYLLWRSWAALSMGTAAWRQNLLGKPTVPSPYLDGQEFKGRTILFVGLNPSMADHTQDDPTVRRLVGFARAWGYDRLLICNLFSIISSEPKTLGLVKDPIGPDNDGYLRAAVAASSLVLAGWGRFAQARERVQAIMDMGLLGPEIYCLGRNNDGSPKHPLYLRADVLPEVFQFEEEVCPK